MNVPRSAGPEAPIQDYQEVWLGNAAAINPDYGLPLQGELHRPYDIDMAAGRLAMRTLTQAGEEATVPLTELSGINIAARIVPQEGVAVSPLVAFRYYKPDQSGYPEARQRLVTMDGFGYGVHPGHRGEAPTWYVHGRHIGSQGVAGDIDWLPSSAWAIKHFSLARVVGGPLGDPLYDAAFRERYRVPEVTPHTKR